MLDIWSLALQIMIKDQPPIQSYIWNMTKTECTEKIRSEFKEISANYKDVTVYGVCTYKPFHYRTIKIRCTKNSEDGRNLCQESSI